MTDKNFILADGRWSGANGIGRFSTEVLARLQHTDIFTQGPKPLSVTNMAWLPYHLYQNRRNYRVYFNVGFNPVTYSSIPYVLTIYDLIHLYAPGSARVLKKIYYETLIKPTVRRAQYVLTISEYSKKTLMEWADIPEEKIVVVSCGISGDLVPEGVRHEPGYPYLLHVGNTKAHKNVARLLQAFAQARMDAGIRLVLTGQKTAELAEIIQRCRLENRIVFAGMLTEKQLAEYYRGALAVMFPSVYEGFGLPVLEAMACGVPALTSNVTSLPEVAGDAAVMVDPYDVGAMADGIERIVGDGVLRGALIEKGFAQVKLFSWDKTAERVQKVLEEV